MVMESLVIGTQRIFASVLQLHSTKRMWYYACTLSNSNQHSLASYLEMTTGEYQSFLCLIGLGSFKNYRGEARFNIVKSKWETFIIEYNLSGEYVHYFDRASADVGDGVKYDGQWIGIGSKEHVLKYQKYKKVPNPSNQYKYFNGKPPAIKNKAVLIRQLHMSMKILMNDSEIMTGDDDESDDDTHDRSIPVRQSAAKSIHVDEVVNLNRFLDDFKEGKRTKDETMKLLSAAVIEVIWDFCWMESTHWREQNWVR